MSLKLIIVAGLPGTGKTFLARRVAKKLGLPYLGTDQIRRQMITKPTYNGEEKNLIYEHLAAATISFLEKGVSCVIDGTFSKKEWRESIMLVAKKFEAKVHVIRVWAEEEVLQQRLQKKRVDSDADYEVHEKLKNESDPWQQPHLLIQSGADSVEVMIGKVMKYLEER